MFLRLIAETAIRLCWLLGDTEDEEGHPVGLTADSVTSRVRQLQVRDLRLLRSAYQAIHEITDEPLDLLPALNEMIAAMGEIPAAPSNLGNLARSRQARKVYAAHRMSSVGIHPGAVLGRVRLDPLDLSSQMVDEAAAVCVGAAELALRPLVRPIQSQARDER